MIKKYTDDKEEFDDWMGCSAHTYWQELTEERALYNWKLENGE